MIKVVGYVLAAEKIRVLKERKVSIFCDKWANNFDIETKSYVYSWDFQILGVVLTHKRKVSELIQMVNTG